MVSKELNILGVRINKITYLNLLEIVEGSIKERRQTTFTGVNVNTINLALSDERLLYLFSQIDIIHPDGIGVYLASKFLFGKDSFTSRITGSDFYEYLIESSLKNNWSFYFFGDKVETLDKILQSNPGLNVKGYCNDFKYINEQLVQEINNSKADILIVGLGSPKQEEWIINYKERIQSKVIIAVGDGIKVFSGTKKRGPKIIQKLGLEWTIRLLSEPKRLWKRYLIGNPIFVFRVLKDKLS